MTNALTRASIIAASLVLAPLSASAGDGHFEPRVDYITIVDSSDIGYGLAEQVGLENYEGPVIVARTAQSDDLAEGYILNLSFSSEAMGPMADHPIFELVDVEALKGAPMFLTDRLTPKRLMAANEIDVEARDMAGFLDMNYAADAVYAELIDGIGEGDYLAVTHRKVSSRLDGQAVFGADVFDPSFISSLMIAEESGADFFGDKALAIVLNAKGEVAAGFEQRVKLLWLANGPNTQDDVSEQADDADGAAATGTSEDGSSSPKDGSSSPKDGSSSPKDGSSSPKDGDGISAVGCSGTDCDDNDPTLR